MVDKRKDVVMAETEVLRTAHPKPSMADASVEAAVRRLGEAGVSREHALKKIDQTLYQVLHKLNGCGIGWTSNLRQMNIVAGMKLNALMVDKANEEDARDGI